MSKAHDNDVSNAELLEAVNAGFSAMQQQMDRRFDEVNQRFDENADEHAAMNRKLDSPISRLDDHDRRIEKLETKLA